MKICYSVDDVRASVGEIETLKVKSLVNMCNGGSGQEHTLKQRSWRRSVCFTDDILSLKHHDKLYQPFPQRHDAPKHEQFTVFKMIRHALQLNVGIFRITR